MDYVTKTILRAQALLNMLSELGVRPDLQTRLNLVFRNARETEHLDVSALESLLIEAEAEVQ